MKINIKKIDYCRLIVMAVTLFILFQALPVHFFADKAEYLFLGKYFSERPSEIFSPLRGEEVSGIHHLFHYRPMERLFWTACYSLSGMNPVSGNILDGALFLLLVVFLYNIAVLLSGSRTAGLVTALFFLSFPMNYKLIHWIGNPTLINFSFTTMALFFLFKSIITNKYFYLFTGLCCFSAAILTTMNAVLIPVLFLIFYLFYNKKTKKDKTVFVIAMLYMGVTLIGVFLLEKIAWRGVIELQPDFAVIHSVNAKYIFHNAISYYRIFIENNYIWLFVITMALFLFRPGKGSFLALIWLLLQVLIYLPLGSCSSRYFTQAMGGFSIFSGIVLIGSLKEKPAVIKIILSGLIFICVFFSIGKGRDNITKIQHSFELARISYAEQKQEFLRLKVLPENSVIYTDNLAPEIFYSWILRTMDRKDVKIEIVDSRNKAQPDLFFEGETSLVKAKEGYSIIIDKAGDWRF
jgi:hypothetical protein